MANIGSIKTNNGKLIKQSGVLIKNQEELSSIKVQRYPAINRYFYDNGYLSINFLSHRVMIMGQELKLTPLEFKLLKEMICNMSIVIEYDDLLTRVWGESRGSKNYLYDYICRLRRKIEPDPLHPKYIVTVPGFGYRFDG